MKHLIVIEHKTSEADDFDGKPEKWETFANAWCAIKPMRGEELLQAQQIHAMVTHKLSTSWQPGITNEMRVVFGDRVLNIESVLNVDERNRVIELICIEVT